MPGVQSCLGFTGSRLYVVFPHITVRVLCPTAKVPVSPIHTQTTLRHTTFLPQLHAPELYTKTGQQPHVSSSCFFTQHAFLFLQAHFSQHILRPGSSSTSSLKLSPTSTLWAQHLACCVGCLSPCLTTLPSLSE